MTEATLAFAREEARREDTRTVDLAALVESPCEDLRDLGLEVTYGGPASLLYPCRSMAKRALRNLIENAVTYGRRALVTLASRGSGRRLRSTTTAWAFPKRTSSARSRRSCGSRNAAGRPAASASAWRSRA